MGGFSELPVVEATMAAVVELDVRVVRAILEGSAGLELLAEGCARVELAHDRARERDGAPLQTACADLTRPLAALLLAAPELEAVVEVLSRLQLADIQADGRLGNFAELEAATQDPPGLRAALELVTALVEARLEGCPSVTLAGVLAGGRLRLDAGLVSRPEEALRLLAALVVTAALVDAALEEGVRTTLAELVTGRGGGVALLEAVVERPVGLARALFM